MNESEQAQVVAQIKRTMEIYKKLENFKGAYPEAMRLLQIVDSQAKKIAEHEKTINEQADTLADFEDLYKVLIKYSEGKIAYRSLRDAIYHIKAMRG